MATSVPAGVQGSTGGVEEGGSPTSRGSEVSGQARGARGGASPPAGGSPGSTHPTFGVVDPGSASPDPGEGNREGLEGLSDAEKLAAEAAGNEQRPEQAAEPFEFAGFEFESPEHAANEFKRALGRLTAQGKQLSEFNKVKEYAADATRAAWGWRERAEQGQSGSPSNRGAEAAGPAGETAPPEAADIAKFADGLDWGQVQQVADEYGTDTAMNYVVRKMSRAMAGYVQQAVRDATAPFRGFHDAVEATHATTQLFDGMASLADEDGEPLYPELSYEGDTLNYPEAVDGVLTIFKAWSPYFADSQEGRQMALHAAVLEFRRMTGGNLGSGMTTNQPNPSGGPRGAGVGAQVRRALQESSSGAEAAAAAMSSRGAPLRPMRGPASPADELDADFARAKSRQNAVFGVTR